MAGEKTVYKMITQEELKRLLHYDPDTGHFTWLVAGRTNPHRIGTIAGSRHKSKKYRSIHLGKRRYTEHRLALLYCHNMVLPNGLFVDHINGIRDDNRIENLRVVDNSTNQKNSARRHNNTSGVLGICFHKCSNTWQVSISPSVNKKKRFHVGNLLDAVALRMRLEKEYGYHENHGREN